MSSGQELWGEQHLQRKTPRKRPLTQKQKCAAAFDPRKDSWKDRRRAKQLQREQQRMSWESNQVSTSVNTSDASWEVRLREWEKDRDKQ